MDEFDWRPPRHDLEGRVQFLEEKFELLERNLTNRLQSFMNHRHPEIAKEFFEALRQQETMTAKAMESLQGTGLDDLIRDYRPEGE